MLYYIANNAIINDNNELNEYRRFSMTNSPSTLQGYLLEDFRLFHLKDLTSRTYSFHHHDFLKIMILLSGNVTYVVEGRSYPLAPWDMVLVDRGQVHRPVVDTAHPYERILLYLSPTFLETYSTKEAPLTRCFETAQYHHSQVLRLSQETLAPFKVLLQKLETNTNFRNDDFAAPLLAKALCLEFLIELNRITLSPKAGFLTESTLDYRISGLLAYINSHLEEPMDVASLSALSGLSSYHMMRLFKQETGYTVGNYITEKRLIKARDLMSQGTCATQACYLCGFQNYSSFLRAYKKRYPGRPKDILNSV